MTRFSGHLNSRLTHSVTQCDQTTLLSSYKVGRTSVKTFKCECQFMWCWANPMGHTHTHYYMVKMKKGSLPKWKNEMVAFWGLGMKFFGLTLRALRWLSGGPKCWALASKRGKQGAVRGILIWGRLTTLGLLGKERENSI
jgi:hypothetical protein